MFNRVSGKYFNEGVTPGSVSNEYNGRESGERMVIITIYVMTPEPVSGALSDSGHLLNIPDRRVYWMGHSM